MWPLHTRTKDEYIRMIEQHMERQEKEPLNDALRQAFEDYRHEEDFTAWCAGVAFGQELPEAPHLQARFMEQFPLSIQPVQVDYAEQLIWSGQIDDGANEARAYLHRIHEAGMQEFFDGYELIRDAVSRAFMMLTSVYTEAGARSYSRRILEHAMLLQLENYWQQRFRTEYQTLTDELKDANLAKLDALWETFFSSGQNLDILLDIVAQCKLPILFKRLEVIAQKFTEEENYKPGDDEIFQLVYQTDRGAFLLA